MNDSILTSIKKLLGIHEDDESFDADIMVHINTVFMILNQLGVGPKSGFRIQDASTTWDEYITDEDDLDSVKTYIYLKVKLIFDPSASSVVTQAIKENIAELEWRINTSVETKIQEV